MQTMKCGIAAAGALLALGLAALPGHAQAPARLAVAVPPAPAAAEPAPRRVARMEPAVGRTPTLMGAERAAPRRAARARADREPVPGLLWSTVGYVVPMPGTEMVRMGMVQEGATQQAANRAPSLEGFQRDGVSQVKAATIHVIIHRPGS